MKFRIGDRVEVEGHDKGLQGSYFSETFLHKNENSSKKLKEYVDPSFVCPEPLLIQDKCYNLHEHKIEKAYKLHDLRVHHEHEKFNASSRASASSSKPRPKHH
ncbi:hypothetical protein M9H77_28457 [Catharanthus roseus]|uniref:Uncharacterized protein n=1 Tax=Catharanthus roseus TaxID=4058 RepID=A0ACC0AFS8_CATRO|nr:hypothetical protein M9H77_28457 [Catharanthus roseus]